MEIIQISGLSLYYDTEEQAVVDEIVLACEQSVEVIRSSWQLPVPHDCRVYVLTSWPRCVFRGAPLGSQILLALTLPLWYAEFKKRWHYSGGWSQRYGKRQVVGIKTPRLIGQTHEPIGESIFTKEVNLEQKVLSIVCHELTHAFSSHLQLPPWMNEGLAMVSVDRCLGRRTVLYETLQLLDGGDQADMSADKINLSAQTREEIVLLYVRGYWLTRFLADTHQDMINTLLKEPRSPQELEGLIAERLKVSQNSFWQEIDQLLVATYNLELT